MHDYFPELDGGDIRAKDARFGQPRTFYKGGGGGGGTTTTTQNIPDELKPLATAYTDKAINLSNQTYNPYSKERYSDLNALQYGAIGGAVDRANATPDLGIAADAALKSAIDGGNNPYLDDAVRRAQNSVTSQFNTASVNSGSFGNSGLQEQYAKSLGEVASQMYGGAYESDANRRMQAIGQAQATSTSNLNSLMSAGQTLQDQEQQQKDFDYAQFQEQQNLPYKQLAAMSGVFGSNLGGSSTSTTQNSGGGK